MFQLRLKLPDSYFANIHAEADSYEYSSPSCGDCKEYFTTYMLCSQISFNIMYDWSYTNKI